MGKAVKLNNMIKTEVEFEIIRLSNTKYRIGYCSQCGSCCKQIHMNSKGTQVAIDWLELHGVKVTNIGNIVKDPREEAKEFTLSLTFPCPCNELVFDNEKENYYCNIYKNRPSLCENYPKNYSGFEKCTYLFVSDTELNKFSKDYTTYWREKHGKKKEIHIKN